MSIIGIRSSFVIFLSSLSFVTIIVRTRNMAFMLQSNLLLVDLMVALDEKLRLTIHFEEDLNEG